jgi:hypothetical protein
MIVKPYLLSLSVPIKSFSLWDSKVTKNPAFIIINLTLQQKEEKSNIPIISNFIVG